MTDAATAPPTTPDAARATLEARVADKGWGAKLLANDAPTLAEFESLTKIASADPGAIAAAKAASPAVGDEPKTAEEIAEANARERDESMSAAIVDDARSRFDLSPDVEKQLRSGREVTSEEFKAVSQ